MLSETYYAQNYAGIIGLGLVVVIASNQSDSLRSSYIHGYIYCSCSLELEVIELHIQLYN